MSPPEFITLAQRQADPVHPALLQGRSTTFGFSTSGFSTSGLGQLVLAMDLLEDLLAQELLEHLLAEEALEDLLTEDLLDDLLAQGQLFEN